MTWTTFRWRVHRALVYRSGWRRPFGARRDRRRLLFVTVRDPICQSQVFPFWFHRRELASLHGIETRELPLADFVRGRNPYTERVDAVGFQTWFDLTPDGVRELAVRLREAFPGARLAYLDWFAPTDLRYAAPLDEYLAAYVKKQVLRDRARYDAPTLGDTNLSDYYARRFGIEYPLTRFTVPASFWAKLWLSPHFAFSAEIMPGFRAAPREDPRPIDLHARIAVRGTEWYQRMRQEALDGAVSLSSRFQVASVGRVSRGQYFRELLASKICFSPFGYGEVCWRDFEAMSTGALLLKPDMAHVDCHPEAFLPYQTYVPLAWDLSDLAEKVEHYVAHEEERRTITRRAHEHIQGYFRRNAFLRDVEPLLRLLQLAG